MDNIVTIKLDEAVTKDGMTPVDRSIHLVSPYARLFNDKCAGWSNNSEINYYFLVQQQNYANELLKCHGYLFLNRVYGMLGIPETKAGQVVGWVYDNPNGDKFVDFGLYNNRNENSVNGYENSFLLDFNVDGMILDLIY